MKILKVAEEFSVILENSGVEKEYLLSVKRILRSRRIVMRLGARNLIKISAPHFASRAEILKFIETNKSWIFKESEGLKERKTLAEYLREHPKVWVLGQELRIIFLETKSKAFFVENFELGELAFSFSSEEELKKLFLEYAKNAISKTFEFFAKSQGHEGLKFSVRDQKSRWASRSSSGSLSFNWRIVLLEPDLQKYIFLHELAHIEFMDHSVSFWLCLSRMCAGAKALDKRISKDALAVFQIER